MTLPHQGLILRCCLAGRLWAPAQEGRESPPPTLELVHCHTHTLSAAGLRSVLTRGPCWPGAERTTQGTQPEALYVYSGFGTDRRAGAGITYNRPKAEGWLVNISTQ